MKKVISVDLVQQIAAHQGTMTCDADEVVREVNRLILHALGTKDFYGLITFTLKLKAFMSDELEAQVTQAIQDACWTVSILREVETGRYEFTICK